MTNSTDSDLPGGPDLALRLWQQWQGGEEPDVQPLLPPSTRLSPSEVLALLRVDQRERWQRGQPRPVESYFRLWPALADHPEAALELVYGEFVLREDLGQKPAAADYLDRFPQYAGRLRQQFELHEALAGDSELSEAGEADTQASLTWDGLPPGKALPIPSVAGYEILSELGRGGMAVVYKARHQDLKRLVALKMILSGAHAGRRELARFRREAEAVARLQHPNIVQIFEVGEQEGRPYFSLEYLSGGSLARKLEGTPLPPREAAHLVEVLARAVHAAHLAGIVHRDLKPANVLLSADGTPKVADFGLAKQGEAGSGQTQEGTILGTPSYMAPEQAGGRIEAIGPAADVYALGAILYECLTGRPPFKAATPLETIVQVAADEPVPPTRLQPKVPRDLETICLKCLAKDSARRYAGAEALAEDLRRFQAGEPILARPAGPLERCRKWARRRPGVAGLSAALVLVAVTAFALVTWKWQEASGVAEAQREARVQADRAAGEAGKRALAEQDARQKALLAAENERKGTRAVRSALEQTKTVLYFSRIGLAHAEWLHNNVERAEQLLDSSPPDRIDWEWHHLQRLCYRDVFRITSRSSWTYAVAYSPDGKYLASCGAEPRVRLWDAATGHEVWDGKGAGPHGLCLAFSPDGTRLAVGFGDSKRFAAPGAIQVWQVPSGKLLHTLSGHETGVVSVAFSPDGRRLVSGAGDGARPTTADAKVWDLGTQTLLKTFSGHRWKVTSVAFLPGGERIVSAGADDNICLWEAATAREVRHWKANLGGVSGLAVSGDGRRLAASGYNWEVKVWETGAERELCTGRGHTGFVLGIALSPDGRRLASAGLDHTVRVWDAQTGREVNTLRGHHGRALSVAFSPDGKRLASGGADNRVIVWDPTQTGAGVSTLQNPYPTFCLAFHPTQQILAVGAAGQVVLWNPRTRTWLRHLKTRPHEVYGVAFSPDGRRLAATGHGGAVQVWDVKSGEQAFPLAGHPVTGTRVAFSPDGRLLASGSEDRTVKVWDAATGKELRTLTGQRARIEGLAFSPDGRRLAVATFREVKLWDPHTGRELSHHDEGGDFSSIAFSPDGRRLAFTRGNHGEVWRVPPGRTWDRQNEFVCRLSSHVLGARGVSFSPDGRRVVTAGHNDHTVRLYDAASGECILTLSTPRNHLLHQSAFSPDGRYLAVMCQDGTVTLWDGLPWGVPLSREPGPVWSVAHDRDGKTLATANARGTVKLWDLPAGKLRQTLDAHASRVRFVAFSPDGATLATASEDQTVKLWDAHTVTRQAVLNGHRAMINSLAFSPDGKTLATASLDRTIKLWDAVTGKDLATLKGHTDGIYSVAFSPDGKTLATAGRDRTVKVWDVTTHRATRTLRHSGIVECVAFSPDGKFLAAGDWAGNVLVRETKRWQVTASKVTFPVTCLAFSPDGRTLAVGGRTGTLTLWSPSSPDPSTTFSTAQDILRTVSFSPDGNTLVTGSHNGRVLSWDVAWLK